MRTLYEIGPELELLGGLMTSLNGEIPDDEVGRAIEQWFKDLGAERDEKIRRYCGLISSLEVNAKICSSEAGAIEEEVKRLKKLGQVHENAAKRLRDRLKNFFEAQGITNLDLVTFKPRIQLNGGQLPLLLPDGWEANAVNAPERFHQTTITLNREEIRSALGQGGELCPRCGEVVIFDTEEEANEAPVKIACTNCPWEGMLEQTARFGERGTQLRLR